ncbi:MAG: hypothetical protein VB049_07350 [Candidatus Pelethousia sp.]|nr:hypothetical protein [Candidatus Pelethousia sp.]
MKRQASSIPAAHAWITRLPMVAPKASLRIAPFHYTTSPPA